MSMYYVYYVFFVHLSSFYCSKMLFLLNFDLFVAHSYGDVPGKKIMNNDLPPSCKFQNLVTVNSEFSLPGLMLKVAPFGVDINAALE